MLSAAYSYGPIWSIRCHEGDGCGRVGVPAPRLRFGEGCRVALNETPFIDRNGVSRFPADGRARSDNRRPAGVGSLGQRGEQFVRFAIDQLAPGVRVVRMAGELDSLTAPLLDRHLQRHLHEGGGHLIVDLSEVTFLSAAGLTSLVTADETATRCEVQLHITGADHRAVARPLEITTLRATLDIHPTMQSIVDTIRGNSDDLIGPGAAPDTRGLTSLPSTSAPMRTDQCPTDG
jgi:anti-sigma B factor antagonist